MHDDLRKATEGIDLHNDEIEYLESIGDDDFLRERYLSYVDHLSVHGKRHAVKTTLDVMMPSRKISLPKSPSWGIW